MFNIDFSRPGNIHFIGIGGISMSGLAQILMSRGFKVSGSDSNRSPLTDRLKEDGARIFIGQRAENITDDIDVAVFTAAVHEDNPEYRSCVEKGIPMMTRAELLGQLMKNYELPIAVSGTHGKTTTTSMLSEVLLAMDTDPTLSVGGMLKSIGGNIRIGSSDIFVAEACEYTNSFLSFFPKMEIILNIDADHLDFFRDIDDIRASFKKFANLLPDDGILFLQNDIPDKEFFTKDLKCRVITFGIYDEAGEEKPDVYATDITYDDSGHPSYVFHGKDESFPVSLSVVGRHNVSNSLSVIAAALELNGSVEDITRALKGFTGTDRRFEYKGSIGDITVIDDYAHHPTEISATLSAAARYPHKKLYVVFQPHTYTRTKALMDDFAKALCGADEVILADIYAARETDTLGISSKTLMEKIQKLGTDCVYFPTFDEILGYILKKLSPGDVLITMGAGDVVRVGEMLLGR